MKRFMMPITVALTVLILTGGFFLPSIVLRLGDRQTIGRLTVTDGSGVSYETKSELKIIDRLRMMMGARSIDVEKGTYMDANTAYQSALSELGTFIDQGIIEFDVQTCRLSAYDVSFFIDSADPSKSMIAWGLYIQDETHDINVAVDDETGILLALNYSINKLAYKWGAEKPPTISETVSGAGTEEVTVVDLIGQTLADYYELTLVGSEPQKSDYLVRFTYELTDGQESVYLHVSITGMGFLVHV